MNTSDQNYSVDLSAEDYDKARNEVAFLLDAFASTIDNIMGGNTAPVGRIAGRDTAKKLPLEIPEPTLEKVIEALARQMQAGFEISLEDGRLRFDRCILREMCGLRKQQPGESLCRLFHHYFDGIANGLLCRPVKSIAESVGERCVFLTTAQ